MKLSKNFNLEEFLFSQTAIRYGIDMTPSPVVVQNIEKLVKNILQPLRNSLGNSVIISSGFRPIQLNQLIKGSKYSAHITGSAADIKVIGYTPLQVFTWLAKNKSQKCDQIINEFNSWVHIGISQQQPRQQLLKAFKNIQGVVCYQAIEL